MHDLSQDESFTLQEKFDFFWETRQAFGRSALLLSGGASLGTFVSSSFGISNFSVSHFSHLGLYHLGVIKTLFEHHLLPRVISGSSVGSIIASMIATRTDEEIPDILQLKGVSFSAFDPVGSGWRKINRLLNKGTKKKTCGNKKAKKRRTTNQTGVLMDIKKLQSYIRENLGDVTFREAFQKTKRILNITVAPASGFDIPRLLNYLTAPDVVRSFTPSNFLVVVRSVHDIRARFCSEPPLPHLFFHPLTSLSLFGVPPVPRAPSQASTSPWSSCPKSATAKLCPTTLP